MANRQYIGARYVPKFFDNEGSNNWVSGITYEPLTVVTYLNDTFTSKKPVPRNIGNPADNSDYWVLTGAYNAHMSELQNEINAIKDVNYVKLSDMEGANATEKLQYAVDNYEYVFVDSDVNVTSVTVSKPVVINLGNHKITSSTSTNNTINVRSSNVEIFNGEIATTEETPTNERGFGSCIYVNDRYSKHPNYSGIKIHDLKLSSNALLTLSILGDVNYSNFYNLDLDGSRSAVAQKSGIGFEWYGLLPTETYHPHNNKVWNVNAKDYLCGVRVAAVFNFDIENVYADSCTYGVALTSGELGGDYAPSDYKYSVNRNINVTNIFSTNCNSAVYISGISGHVNSDINANITNVEACNKTTGGYAVNTDYSNGTTIRNVKAHGLQYGIVVRGIDETIENCTIFDIQNIGIVNEGDNTKIIGNRIYNINQSQQTGVQGCAISSSGSKTNALVMNNVIGGGNTEHLTFTIRNASNNSILTNNILYGSAITDISTGSVVDNNVVIS